MIVHKLWSGREMIFSGKNGAEWKEMPGSAGDRMN